MELEVTLAGGRAVSKVGIFQAEVGPLVIVALESRMIEFLRFFIKRLFAHFQFLLFEVFIRFVCRLWLLLYFERVVQTGLALNLVGKSPHMLVLIF